MTCWGNNADGQLGDGSTTSSNVPVAVVGITDAVSLAAGNSHTCAVLSDDTVTCWGDNLYGQLGNGSNVDSSTPVAVAGITDATVVAGGNLHTCAVRSVGSVSCWGYNTNGQLVVNVVQEGLIRVIS